MSIVYVGLYSVGREGVGNSYKVQKRYLGKTGGIVVSRVKLNMERKLVT